MKLLNHIKIGQILMKLHQNYTFIKKKQHYQKMSMLFVQKFNQAWKRFMSRNAGYTRRYRCHIRDNLGLSCMIMYDQKTNQAQRLFLRFVKARTEQISIYNYLLQQIKLINRCVRWIQSILKFNRRQQELIAKVIIESVAEIKKLIFQAPPKKRKVFSDLGKVL